jgi:hypothetical protein
MSTAQQLLNGATAGAVGTAVLNMTTYLDMTVRGRPSSTVPQKAAGKLADRAGVDLTGEGQEQKTAANRRSGLGALLGYATGLGVGAAYGLLRPRLESVSVPLAGVGLGVAAMAGSDVPNTLLGITDPRTWSASSWMADIVPHLAYGLATAAAYEALEG